jgi:glutamine synthetase
MKQSHQTATDLHALGVHTLILQFTDIHGTPRGKLVPVEHLDMVLGEGGGFAGFSIWGLGIEPHGPDFYAVGQPETLQALPWRPGYARIVGDGYVHGKPWPLDSRICLKRQVQAMAERGWIVNMGLEPEFSLLRIDQDGRPQPADALDTHLKPSYDLGSLYRHSDFLETLVRALREAGLDIYQIDHEDANGQYEVNFRYADALTSCDRYQLFKMAATEIATAQGLLCSFMAKPFANRPGNGLHLHVSLADDQGRKLFDNPADPRGLGLSSLGYHFMAGLLVHARALAALCAPTVNSYKRLVVGRSLTGATWAPAYIRYGANNRSCLVRVPPGRIEWRLPDAGCNPYLATAAVIAAGLDGIERRLEPGEPCHDNLHDWSLDQIRQAGIGLLPQDLREAVDALEADTVLCEALGPVACEFIDLKRCEWVEYMRHISDWEIDHYLRRS